MSSKIQTCSMSRRAARAVVAGIAGVISLSVAACAGAATSAPSEVEISPIAVKGDPASAAESIAIALDTISGNGNGPLVPLIPGPITAAPGVPPAAFLSITTWPGFGSVEIDESQTVVYTAGPDFGGVDQFEYTVTYADGSTSVAVVRVSVPQLLVAAHE